MNDSANDTGATWSNTTLTSGDRGRVRIDGRNEGEWISAAFGDVLTLAAER